MTTNTYERIRLRECRYVADDVAVCKVAIDIVLTYLVELSDEAENGLSFRLTLLERQAHWEEIFHEVVQQWRRVLFDFKGRSFRRQPTDGILDEQTKERAE